MKGEEEEKLVSNQPGNAAKKRYRRHELDEEEDNIFKMISSGDEGCVCVCLVVQQVCLHCIAM